MDSPQDDGTESTVRQEQIGLPESSFNGYHAQHLETSISIPLSSDQHEELSQVSSYLSLLGRNLERRKTQYHDFVNDEEKIDVIAKHGMKSVRGQTLVCLRQNIDNIDAGILKVRSHLAMLARRWLTKRPGILDLPNELLTKIMFEVVHDCYTCMSYEEDREWDSGLLQRDPVAIYHIRYTCRRFRDVGAFFLIQQIYVDISEASLQHLELVSSHHLVSKGVEALSISIQMCNHTTAEDFDVFKDFVIRTAKIVSDTIFFPDGTFISNARSYVDKWQKDNGMDHQSALWQGYQYYRLRYKEQMELLRDGAFYRRLITAMDSMPRARRLEVHDGTKPEDLRGFRIMSEIMIIRELACYPKWSDHPRGLTGIEPVLRPAIPNLLVGLSQLSTPIISLSILLVDFPSRSLLWDIPTSSTDSQAHIRAAVSHLQSFYFEDRTAEAWEHTLEEPVHPLRNLLSAVCKSDMLENLYLWAKLSPLVDEARPTRESFIGVSDWCKMSKCKMTSIQMRYEEIASLLEARPEEVRGAGRGSRPKRKLMFDFFVLMDGSWADLLDCARAATKAGDEVSFLNPYAAEYETFDRFEQVWGMPGLGRKYIMGEIHDNPLHPDFVYEPAVYDESDADAAD